MTIVTVFVVLTLTGLAGVFLALGAGIVMVTRRRWWATLVLAGVTILCGIAGIGGAVGLAVYEGVPIVAANHGMHGIRANDIKALTPSVDFTTVDDQFWDYDGEADWWRAPVRYPYDLQFIDELKRGDLCRNIANGRSANGNRDNETVVSHITHFAVEGQMLVYRCENFEGTSAEYGVFFFDKGTNEKYATEAEAWKGAAKAGWVKPEILDGVENYHHWYWGY